MAGTGTSSTGKELAIRLGYPFASGGDMGRLTASELGITINELDELSKTDKKYDLLRDEHLRNFGQTHLDCVIEARLGWFNVPDSFKIKLFCDDETRIGRIMKREGKTYKQVQDETMEREHAIRERFKAYYDMDFDRETEDRHFNLVIDTGKHSLEEVLNTIQSSLKSYES